MKTEPVTDPKEFLENATHQQLLAEWDKCLGLWGKYSCDCFGFYISALGEKIQSMGGFPIK